MGIEMEGCGELPFSDFQYAQLGQLVRVLGRTYGIEDIVGHADIAPGRKTDPGPNFDWRRLHAALVD
jgi:AmpD protein